MIICQMILLRNRFLLASALWLAAAYLGFASEPKVQTLKEVQVVTMQQMWLEAPHPVYPAEALKKRLVGSGVFDLKIQPKTYKVTQVTVVKSTGHKILDDAVIKALSRWRGRPSEMMSRVNHVHVPVTF